MFSSIQFNRLKMHTQSELINIPFYCSHSLIRLFVLFLSLYRPHHFGLLIAHRKIIHMQYFRNVNLVVYRNHVVCCIWANLCRIYLSISLSVFVVLLYNERPRIIIQTLLLFSMELADMCVLPRSNDWILLRLSSVFEIGNDEISASMQVFIYLFVCLG